MLCKEFGITRKDFAKQCFDLFGVGWDEMDNEQRQEVIDCYVKREEGED